jgi:predicted peptidase
VYDYEGLTTLPIWVAHNVNDDIVDHFRSEIAVRNIERLSGETFHRTATIAEADYQQYDLIFTSGQNPASRHDAWTEAFSHENFYRWLLRFSKEEGR